MKATELRIGNLVNGVLTQKPYIIDAWALREMESGNYQNSQDTETKVFEPIPLTEEWLLKFGFSKQDYKMSGCYIYKLGTIIIMNSFLDNGRKDMGITVEGISPPTWSLADLYFVHQLQNLYFALIGEELTFKSK